MSLELATTFATIISLISDFRDKHKEIAADDYQRFVEWLSDNRHEEIKKILEQNQATITSIKIILNQDYEVIIEKLQNVDSKLATLLSKDGIFSKLVEAINPSQILSKQAKSILMQFEGSQASKLIEARMMAGTVYIFMDGSGGNLNFDEPRFIQDDFVKLTELGLLLQDYNSAGKPLYVYTRVASEFVKGMGN